MKDSARKSRGLNLLDVLVVLVIATAVSFFVLPEIAWFIGGTALVLGGIYLVMVWDDIVIWWSTRKR